MFNTVSSVLHVFFAFKVTLNEPPAVYWWKGLPDSEESPSPKYQVLLSGLLEVLVKVTLPFSAAVKVKAGSIRASALTVAFLVLTTVPVRVVIVSVIVLLPP